MGVAGVMAFSAVRMDRPFLGGNIHGDGFGLQGLLDVGILWNMVVLSHKLTWPTIPPPTRTAATPAR